MSNVRVMQILCHLSVFDSGIMFQFKMKPIPKYTVAFVV